MATNAHSGLMSLYQQIARLGTPHAHAAHLDVLAHTGFVFPAMLLAQERLPLFDRLLQVDLPEVMVVLQAQPDDVAWFSLVRADAQHLCSFIPGAYPQDVSRPENIVDMAVCTFRRPKFFSRLFVKAKQVYQQYLKLWQIHRQFEQDFDEDLAQFQIEPMQLDRPSQAKGAFICDHCPAQFDTFQKLCVHMSKKHLSRHVVQLYTASIVCRACLRIYNSRQSVINHLKYLRTGCLLKLVSTTKPLSEAELVLVLEEEAEDRRKTRCRMRQDRHRRPVDKAVGPLVPWRRHLASIRADLRSPPDLTPSQCASWAGHVFDQAMTCDVSKVLQALRCYEYHGQLLRFLFEHEHSLFTGPVSALNLESKMCMHEALHLWQDDALCPNNMCRSQVPSWPDFRTSLHRIRSPSTKALQAIAQWPPSATIM